MQCRKAFAQKSHTIHLPLHITEKLNRIGKIKRALAQQIGRTPTIVGIAEVADLSPIHLQDYFRHLQSPISLDRPIGESDMREFGNRLEETISAPEPAMMEFALQFDVENLLLHLNDSQRQIIVLRFELSYDLNSQCGLSYVSLDESF